MNQTKRLLRYALMGFILCLSIASVDAANLEKEFVSPPPSSRPWVYWFWMDGNITKEGITADLEAMQRVGIGGALIMEICVGVPPKGPVEFLSPEWRVLFKHVVSEARRLGLEVNMNNDAGWNGSGGPWIKPEQSMQKVVWSETDLAGPQHFEGVLRQPDAVAEFYRDITVLAFPKLGDYRIPRIEGKAAYQTDRISSAADSKLPPEMLIERDRMVDLSSRMDAHGHLAWDVPQGNWTIIRFGRTSTGRTNAPAPLAGTGLDCDKLSKEGVEANFNGMMAKLIADAGPDAGRSLVATHVDSWENGAQNWTAQMREDFRQRRSYDPLPYLPAMTGRVVGSLEISERFLWDLRQTISELIVENYAGRLRELANAHGLRFTVEGYYGNPCDSIPYAGQADEPMAEFWTGGYALETAKGMASAAHVYGKPVVGAESFTSSDFEKWLEYPASIKSLGDQAFCEGINRFVFHRFAMQPWADGPRPGMTMGMWGVHYDRTQTWWEQSIDWHRYLSRCQFMLRQGLSVADICYLQAETPPQAFRLCDRQGYDWDECGAEVVLTRMSVKDGRIMLPNGMSYRVLALPESRVMTPRLLRKITDLVQAGATVVGPPPLKSPSLSNYPDCDQEVKRLSEELWSDCDGKRIKERQFGQGRVAWERSPEKYLARSGVPSDFRSQEPLRYIHRVAQGVDIYFVANSQSYGVTAACSFRVSNKVPELWWPDTGRIERAGVYENKNGLTNVSLPLGPSGSVFVIFREPVGKADPIVSVMQDGKPVLSAVPTDSAPTIIVQKAIYGMLEDPKQTRDVRDKVQEMADTGDCSIPVLYMAENDMPAPEAVKKTLVVDYTIDGKPFTVKAQDGDSIRLSREAVQIHVEKATYGIANDTTRTIDARAIVQRFADRGDSAFQIEKIAYVQDPAILVKKTLSLDYTIDGKRVSVTGMDGSTIAFVPAPPKAMPSCELLGQGRRLDLIAWQPGQIALTRNSGKKANATIAQIPADLEINSPWEVLFPPNAGAPEKIRLDKLISLSQHADPGVKYFSGTASYHTGFRVPKSLIAKGRKLRLDLGNVKVIAQVKINGKDLGVIWKPPFSADVTNFVKPGKNELDIRVTNLWPNRMIGDEQLPEDSDRNPKNGTLRSWPQWLLENKPSPTGRYTFATWRLWKKDDALLESGLIGPVKIQAAQGISIKDLKFRQ